MKVNYINAHRKYLPIDKTSREVHPSHESIQNFPKQAKLFQQAYNKMDFAESNNQQHQLAEHGSYYLEMDHLNSMGKLSTEGNEAGNRRFKTEKKLHTFTGSVQIQMEQTLRFEWVATSPSVLKALHYKPKTFSCGKCGSEDHIKTNRICPLYNVP